jgi:flagellar hook assembly protein FlgD
MNNLTLLTAIRLINKMVKVSEIHIHTTDNNAKVVWSLKIDEVLESIYQKHL